VKLNSRILLAFCSCLLASITASFASDDVRLSRTLIPSEYAESGLKQLTSDQIAILDALVRRDTAASLRGRPAGETRAVRFSERLTADERKNAGLTLLSESELVKLDEYVARLTAPADSPSGSFAAGQSTYRPAISAKTLRRAPEIHGMISLMYGQGSGGYSERGGAMVLTYDDPSGISLAVGYSEIRTKGGNGYYLRDYRDRYYDGFGPRMW
jgi:hypothetical protein